jgi:hypothetical protein
MLHLSKTKKKLHSYDKADVHLWSLIFNQEALYVPLYKNILSDFNKMARFYKSSYDRLFELGALYWVSLTINFNFNTNYYN